MNCDLSGTTMIYTLKEMKLGTQINKWVSMIYIEHFLEWNLKILFYKISLFNFCWLKLLTCWIFSNWFFSVKISLKNKNKGEEEL